MARPRTITDEQILDATREAVLEHGAQVSLDLVAGQLGVTSPALLKRYKTRRALFIAALKPSVEEFEKIFAVAPDTRPFVEQLESLLDRVFKNFAKSFPCMMALRESGIPPDELDRELKLPRPVHAVKVMARWLQAQQDAGLINTDAIETAATAILGSVSTRAISSHLMNRAWSSRSQREYQRECASLFARALGIEPKSQNTLRKTVAR